MFAQKCPLRKDSPPVLPCDCKECDWYIFSTGNNNCFWVLCDYMEFGQEYSFEEIAEFEGISKEKAMEIYEQALSNIRQNPEKMNAFLELLRTLNKSSDSNDL